MSFRKSGLWLLTTNHLSTAFHNAHTRWQTVRGTSKKMAYNRSSITCGNETGGVHCEMIGTMVTPEWPPTTGQLTWFTSRPWHTAATVTNNINNSNNNDNYTNRKLHLPRIQPATLSTNCVGKQQGNSPMKQTACKAAHILFHHGYPQEKGEVQRKRRGQNLPFCCKGCLCLKCSKTNLEVSFIPKFSRGDTPKPSLRKEKGKNGKGRGERKGGGCIMAVGGWKPLKPRNFTAATFAEFKQSRRQLSDGTFAWAMKVLARTMSSVVTPMTRFGS